MRPINLTIDGFTSFKKETHISFQDMDVFAITGENGAGKSSILEAMLFALYGKTSRLGSEKKDLISLGRDRLAVSLEFEAGNSIYKVTRSFKTKGSPFIKLELLEKDSWKEVSHGKEVEKEVERILRMPYEAFTRAVLIPQGHFDAFLNPNTPRERRQILMELFDLHVYEKMRERAQQIRSETEGRREGIENQLNTRFQNATEKDLKEAREEQQQIEEKGASLQNQREQLKAEHSKMNSVMELNRSYQDAKIKFESLQINLKECSAQRKIAEEKHVACAKALIDIPNLELTSQELSRAAEQMQTLLQKRRLLADCEISLKEIASFGNALGRKLEKMEERKKGLVSDLHAIRIRAQETGFDQAFFDDLLAVYNDARELATLRESILRLYETIQKGELRTAEDQETLQHITRVLSQISSDNERKKKEWEQAEKQLEALLLKQRLQPGDPCPVCGAILKTAPRISEQTVSDARTSAQSARATCEELHKLQEEKLEEKARREAAWNHTKIVLSENRSESAKKEKQLHAQESGLKDRWPIPDRMNPEDFVMEQYEAQKNLREEFRRLQSGIQDMQQAIHDQEKEILQLQSELKVKETEHQTVEHRRLLLINEISPLEQSVQKHLIKKKHPDDILASLQREQEQIRKKIGQIREEARSAEMSWIKFQEAESAVGNQVNAQREVYEELLRRHEKLTAGEKKYSPENLLELETRMESIHTELQSNQRVLGAVHTKIENIRAHIKTAKQLQKEAKKLGRKAELYKTLALQLGSKALQEFVVATILAKLIEAANLFLQDLTQNRYGLDLQQDNIVVKDSWSGDESRITQTLSGGESFVVSLSLAMALTEFIGGSHLGSLFLDEGFGSLDREKLDLVYEALGKVIGAGKLIAVVTHVDELANRFPFRLHVTNEPSGSEVRLIFPETTF